MSARYSYLTCAHHHSALADSGLVRKGGPSPGALAVWRTNEHRDAARHPLPELTPSLTTHLLAGGGLNDQTVLSAADLIEPLDERFFLWPTTRPSTMNERMQQQFSLPHGDCFAGWSALSP